jgi:hypothetical protein
MSIIAGYVVQAITKRTGKSSWGLSSSAARTAIDPLNTRINVCVIRDPVLALQLKREEYWPPGNVPTPAVFLVVDT